MRGRTTKSAIILASTDKNKTEMLPEMNRIMEEIRAYFGETALLGRGRLGLFN